MVNLWPADFWNVDQIGGQHRQDLLRRAESERRVRELRTAQQPIGLAVAALTGLALVILARGRKPA